MEDERRIAIEHWAGFHQRMIANGLHRVRGCTAAQIKRVQEDQGVPLPLYYEVFLATMGWCCGGMFVGDDLYCPEVIGLRQMAKDLLWDSAGLVLDPDALVFWAHEGYQLSYMKASEGINPCVYYFLEGDPAPRKSTDRFTDWMERRLEDEVEIRKSGW